MKVHIKGGTGSRRSIGSKPSFKVDIGGDNRFFGLEHLTLNNMVQDATMLHEALGYQVYEAAGAKAALTGYARLTVNGQSYGLYLNLETTDAHFLKRVFGDAGGLLYEGAYGVDLRAGDAGTFELHSGEDPDRATLRALIRAVDTTPGDGFFYGPSRQVDTESFLATMAADALLGNWDSYYTSNNFRLYRDTSAGLWFLIPSGIDQAFSGTAVFGATGLLFQKCLASVRCTTDYAHSVRDVASRFEGISLLAKTAALLSIIDPAAQADPKKKYNANAMAEARTAMLAFIARRPDEVRAALSCMDDSTIGACAGVVVVNATANQCAEVPKQKPEDKPEQDRSAVAVSVCLGTANQRWRLVAKGRCRGADVSRQRKVPGCRDRHRGPQHDCAAAAVHRPGQSTLPAAVRGERHAARGRTLEPVRRRGARRLAWWSSGSSAVRRRPRADVAAPAVHLRIKRGQ